MNQVLAWKCEDTGALFEDEKLYRAHRRRHLRDLALEREHKRQRDQELADIAPLYERQTFGGIEKWLVQNWHLVKRFGRHSIDSGRRQGNLVKVHFYGMRYGDQSNTHNAPLGKETNWGGDKKDVPRSYPGWHGRVDFIFDNDGEYDPLRTIGMGIGCGSGQWFRSKRLPNGYKFAADVIVWEDDFPKLKRGEGLDKSTWGARDLMALEHDIMHYDRATVGYRAEKWAEMLKDQATIQTAGGESAYSRIYDVDEKEREANYAARAFGRSHNYLVRRFYTYDHKLRDRLEREDHISRHGAGERSYGMLPLGRSFTMNTFVCNEVDEIIKWKLSGEIQPEVEIIDLKARAERLVSKRLITRLP